MASLINIGVNGLHAQQAALNTTGNNITNANTPGYSRQRVELATLPEHMAGAGYMGQGSQVNGINRIIDEFLVDQLRVDTASFHQTDALTSQFSQLDSLLADASTGVAPALQGFFDALQQASLDPTSIPVRQVVLSTAGTLAQRFDSLHGRLQAQESVINAQLSALTGQASSIAQGIAELNQQISQQTNGSAQPNALLDKRDELTRELSELVGVKAVPQGNGMVNIFIGNGQPLVVGTQATRLATQPMTTDASREEVVISRAGGNQEVSQFITGGQIGGLLKFRSEGLDKAFNQLGQLALSVADEFNKMQQQGMDLDGHYGSALTDSPLFKDINTQNLRESRAIGAPTNAGTAKLAVTVAEGSELTASDYSLVISADGAGYTLTRLNGGGKTSGNIAGGLPIKWDGLSIDLAAGSTSADLSANDSFTLRPTRQGADAIALALTDPRDLALALAPLVTSAGPTNAGSGSIAITSFPAATADDEALMSELFPASALSITVADADAGTLTLDYDPAIPVTGTFTAGAENYITVSYVAGALQARIDDGSSPVSDDVLQFSLSSGFQTGDNFTVDVNEGGTGTSDNRNALAMLDLRMANLVGKSADDSGGQSFSGSYGSLVSSVGARTAELKINQEAADSILVQSQSNRDATSGVNLDEEAANLIRFEQAYNASAQVISVARSLFDSLLSAFR